LIAARRDVSFSAISCPHCGSTEPTGPYQLSRKETRRLRIEQRNDNNLLVTTLSLGVIGVLYGIVINVPSLIWEMVGAIGYGAVGVLLGVPVAATFNMVRHLGYFAIPVALVLILLAVRLGIAHG
jgi:hypothetical protein